MIRALERDHSHTVEMKRWGELLRQDDPEGYGDRPLPTQPTDLPPGPERIELYTERAEWGFGVFHPRDVREIGEENDRLAVQGVLGIRQGGIVVEGEEVEEDDDDDIRLAIPDGRARARLKGSRKARG